MEPKKRNAIKRNKKRKKKSMKKAGGYAGRNRIMLHRAIRDGRMRIAVRRRTQKYLESLSDKDRGVLLEVLRDIRKTER